MKISRESFRLDSPQICFTYCRDPTGGLFNSFVVARIALAVAVPELDIAVTTL